MSSKAGKLTVGQYSAVNDSEPSEIYCPKSFFSHEWHDWVKEMKDLVQSVKGEQNKRIIFSSSLSL